MIQGQQKTLALFFSYRMALDDWVKGGMLDREVDFYKSWLKFFGKVYLVTYGTDDRRYQDRLPEGIVVLPKKSRLPDSVYSFLIPFYYRKQLRQVSLFRTNQMIGSWSGVIAKWLYRKPLVVRTGYTQSRFAKAEKKSVWKRALVGFIEWLAYKNADQAIVTSGEDKKYLLERYRNIAPITVVPNAVNTEVFKPNESRKRRDSSFKTRFLFVGRLIDQKNVLNLIEAFKEVKDAHLTMIGSGPLRENLKFRITNYELRNKIKLIDSVPNHELSKYYTEADIYVQPSLFEGNPKTILEAMSCGLSVIAAQVEGVVSLIQHLKNGYLCSPDVASIRNAMQFLQRDGALRAVLGRNAREFIKQNYELGRVVKKELAIYENLTLNS